MASRIDQEETNEPRHAWLALILTLALVLAACGSGGAGADETQDTTSEDGGGSGSGSDPEDGSDTDLDGGGTTETAGSTDQGDDGDGAVSSRLVVAQGVDPRTFTPWASLAAELSVTTQIFERLISFNLDTGDYDPVLAESYEWTDDVTLVIPLREAVTFSNGEPFDADAAIFSLGALMDPETGGVEMSSRTGKHRFG